MEPWTVAPVSVRPVDRADVLALFATQGWWPDRTEAVMGTVLASGPSVGAWAGGRLVGFARAVSDGPTGLRRGRRRRRTVPPQRDRR